MDNLPDTRESPVSLAIAGIARAHLDVIKQSIRFAGTNQLHALASLSGFKEEPEI
jgi:hypothetical protein